MHRYSDNDRTRTLEHASKQFYDLIVIGGGVTGAGIALDASHNGLKTLLLDKADFASGTSGKSTKLIHGGLRYLKQLEVGLVKESGLERAVVHRLIPHLVHPEKMLLPIVKKGSFGKLAAALAISVYDFLAKVKQQDKRESLSKSETLIKEPLLNEQILKAGVRYSEYRTDDARLTISLIKRAADLGCDVFNYLELTGFNYTSDGLIESVKLKDQITDQAYAFESHAVVSATGPWVDEIRKEDGSLSDKHLFLSKGSHVVVAHSKLPIKQAVYFDDFKGRMIFAIPRQQVTYIGTTDLAYRHSLDDVFCSQEEANYLLDATNQLFPSARLSLDDIESSWAGLRPLIHQKGKGPTELSRRDEVFNSVSGLISIAGGKLTGYRKMAERVVMNVIEKYFPEKEYITTEDLFLSKHPFDSYAEVLSFVVLVESKLPETLQGKQIGEYLVFNYGREAVDIIGLMGVQTNDLTNKEKLIKSELLYTIEQEFVIKPLDFFTRRTGKLYFDLSDVQVYSKLVLQSMQDIFDWDQLTLEANRAEIKHAVARCLQCKKIAN